ncbi:hypothetical protein [Chrysiogenes arsenatis]|uniref:hypothetical protein n=1 Tax=Chrysiogenes arsenatis TaxID=309797 RepID=UPI0004217B74|nr:hypothetical protein [Chrysiogenes arsenatis]
MSEQRYRTLQEAWILCFLLGVVMINYPFTHIFNKASTILGIPLMVLYFLVGWPLSVGVIYLFTRTLASHHDESSDGETDETDESRDPL